MNTVGTARRRPIRLKRISCMVEDGGRTFPGNTLVSLNFDFEESVEITSQFEESDGNHKVI